jgi:serine/threonine protein kinase
MQSVHSSPTRTDPVMRTPLGCRPYSPGIISRFAVLGTLGGGGFAEVFDALDRENGENVAIKVIKPVHWGNPAVERLMRAESSALARLDHERVPKLIFRPEGDRINYFVMERLPGASLKSLRVYFHGDIRKIIGLGMGICDVLSYIHQAGIIHRDLKPDNLLVYGLGGRWASIIDFGYAKVALLPDYCMSAKHFTGTPEYGAPEQTVFPGSPTDPRTDLYALGVILYELVSGRLPFHVPEGGDRSVLLQMHRETPAPPIGGLAGIPGAMYGILAKALEKKPEDRFQSASEFRDALAGCPGGP